MTRHYVELLPDLKVLYNLFDVYSINFAKSHTFDFDLVSQIHEGDTRSPVSRTEPKRVRGDKTADTIR